MVSRPRLIVGSSQEFCRFDTQSASHNIHYVNRVADALLKATRISIGVSAASCDETLSGIWCRFYMCWPIALKAASSK